MEPPEPEFNPEIHLKTMQSIFERMERAGWITDPNPLNSIPWWNALNELGQQRVARISDALIRCSPSAFKAKDLSVLTADSIVQPTPAELFLTVVELRPLFAELQPPPFSTGEETTVLGIFYQFAREHSKGLIPPTRWYRPPPV